jgi:HSP20 family protein
MNITKWNPFGDLERFFDEKFFSDPIGLSSRAFKIDIWEDEASVNIKAELPGFKKENISIELVNDSMVITAEDSNEVVDNDPTKTYYRKEISSRSFKRHVMLPCEVYESTANATYEDGYLTIRLQKLEPSTSSVKKIEVK